MKYARKTIDYDMNLEAFEEMDLYVPMTKYERKALRKWVRKGHDIETNPWDFLDSEGYPLNYLQAYRLKNGYSSGPWDYWKGPEQEPYFREADRHFYKRDYFD